MFKKLIVTGATAAILLSSAAGAFANEHHQSLPTLNFNLSNLGTVTTTVDTTANTGYNSITGGSVNNSGITTGAANAGSNVTTQLNWNQFNCGCLLGLGGNQNLNFSLSNNGMVYNTVGTSANTGFNSITANGGSRGENRSRGSSNGVNGSWITTGAAGASSVVQNIVNTNMFGSVTPL